MSEKSPISICFDLHTHTLVSTHAFSTLKEMTDKACALGLRGMAVTDHAIAMPDAPHEWYFFNLLRMPTYVEDGFILLKGMEANVVDKEGRLDMDEWLLKSLDWVIASLHTHCIQPLSVQDATHMWLCVAENPYIDMIGHAEEERWKFDYERVVPVFAQKNKVVELNGNSPQVRHGNEKNLRELMLCCKRYGAKIAVTSDAHSLYDFENYRWALDLLADIDFPPELVVNSSLQRLKQELALHGRKVAQVLNNT